MGTPHRLVSWSAREEVLSTDLVRGEQVLSKAIQDQALADSIDNTLNPISSIGFAPAWAPASGFTVNYGPGSGHQFSTSGVGADDSPFQVIEFPVTLLTFATPDATNPRIDLIVGTAATVAQDLGARNILQDPNTRTQTVANVAKTSQPLTTLQVVTGTPAATPLPPAVPAGAIALHEVWVPAGAANSAAFPVPAPRLFRRAGYPWSVMNGIIAGAHLTWDASVNPSTTSSPIVFDAGTAMVVIDGEVIDCSTLSGLTVQQDLANNPFGSAAGASDKPYYIYAIGGRHAPQATLGLGGLFPVAIVESTVPPNVATGRPTATITTARGVVPVNAAVYLGIGFVVATTTFRRACIMGDEMTYIVGSDVANALQLTKTGSGVEALGTLGSRPTVSRKVQGMLGLTAASAIADVFMLPDDGTGTAASPGSAGSGLTHAQGVKTQVAANLALGSVTFFFNPSNAKIWIGGSVLATSDAIVFSPNAYDHRVRKFASLG